VVQPAGADPRARVERVRLGSTRGRKVQNAVAARDQRVGEDAAVAVPPVALGAQHRDGLFARELFEPGKAARELGGLQRVGVRAKRRLAQRSVLGAVDRDLRLEAAAELAAEKGVADPASPGPLEPGALRVALDTGKRRTSATSAIPCARAASARRPRASAQR
jgi:hypothetical protein